MINQKSFSQERVSVTTDDSLRFRVAINDTSYIATEKSNPYRDKYLTVDFGSINNEYDHKVSFYFTNHSDTPLVFSWVGWGEPNFAPESSPKEPLLKGQTAKITYKRLERKYPGAFNKTARVTTNLGQFFISFNGYTLPENIYQDKQDVYKTITLGDTIFSEFKIYNKSDSILRIEKIQNDWRSFISFDKDELIKFNDVIPANSFRTFKVMCIPSKTGDNKSKVIITINNTPVEFNIFATVKANKG